jgi:lipopolysaccharide transport system ATP-binding protein
MNHLALHIHDLGKSYRLTSAQVTKRHRKRRVLTEDIMNLISPRQVEDGFLLWALREIAFEVERGTVLGIMGPNGAGKSTLLKLLSRITYPTTGYIDVWGRTGALLEVGTGFHSELTGRENIFLSGSIMGMTRNEIQAKFDEIVEFSGVEAFLDMPVKRYSSGMEMRLAFSVAAHLEAEILFIDEVLAVGDAAFQQKCMRKMESIARHEGRTILFVSHNMKAISELCTQAIVLNRGELAVPPTSVSQALLSYQNLVSRTVGESLADRRDRSGLGAVRCIGLSVKGIDGGIQGEITAGQPLVIRVQLQTDGQLVEKVRVQLDLAQPDGQPLVSFQSPTMDLDRGDTGIAVVACRIQDLPVSPGVVQINLTIDSDGRLQDKLAHAGYFVVVDQTGSEITGEQPPYPTLQIPHSWQQEPHD